MPAILLAFALAFTVRLFLFEPYASQSSSMLPTVAVGEAMLVSKLAQPKRGDVVVFTPPATPGVAFVKRLIGLPGDKVQMIDGRVFLNDVPLVEEDSGDFLGATPETEGQIFTRFRETLPDGTSYEVLDMTSDGPLDNTGVYEVPAGHVFVLGDNRDNSVDSRLLDQVGFVPEENVVGPVLGVYYAEATGRFGWRSLMPERP